jgi:predicted GTPase
VVGVVGNTEAGKSSVINAMLDEERLVPTNCMRACTAVVTEISWNKSTDPYSKYRAEIEFITKADWEKELVVIMKEFLTKAEKFRKIHTIQILMPALHEQNSIRYILPYLETLWINARCPASFQNTQS